MVDLQEKTRLCSVCFKMCRDFCSVAGATRHEADSPHNRGFFAQQVAEERETLTGEIVDYFFRCSMCKTCREACETGMDTSEIMLAARRDLPDDLLPETVRAAKRAVTSGTYWGKDSAGVKKLLSDYQSTGGALPILYFGQRLRSGTGSSIRSALNVLNKLGVKFGVMADEPSTGQIARFFGFTAEATKLGESFARAVRESGAPTVVVFCADDLRMIKKEYPVLGVEVPDIEIVSAPEFLDRILTERAPALKQWEGPAVTYHDPCALGRELRVFEAPRRIIASAAASGFREMALVRDQVPCCGWGMGLEIAHPEISRLMADRLVAMAPEVGAGTLVTGCPTCRETLIENRNGGGSPIGDDDIVDLFQFIERVLP
jgi:Fe-S oxidoreductase